MSVWNNKNESKFKVFDHGIRNALKKSNISENTINDAMRKIESEIKKVELPRIALIGFTGVGKSSTLNALFNAGQPTSDVRACTQKEAPIIGEVSKYTGSKGSVIVYDMPGLGEDIKSDERHFKTYLNVLPIVDVAVWTFQVGDRAMTPMQDALNRLKSEMGKDFCSKLMFAINKADAIAPGELAWNKRLNSPSIEQNNNIRELEEYVKEKIEQVLPEWSGKVVTYSARTRYRLDALILGMVETMSPDRRWLLDSVADIADQTELMDTNMKEFVTTQIKGRSGEWRK